MRRLLLAAALLAAASAAPAQAGQIFVSNMAFQNGHQTVTLAGGVFGNGATYLAGQQMLTANFGSTNNPAQHFAVFAWCIDVYHTINLGKNAIVYTTGTPTQNGNGVALTAQQRGQISWLADYGNRMLSSGPNALLSAAVQTLIWNVEYGSRYAGTDQAMVRELDRLAKLLPADATAVMPGIALTATNAQGAIVAQTLVTTAVPEPGTLLLLGAGLVALGAARWRGGRRGAQPAAA